MNATETTGLVDEVHSLDYVPVELRDLPQWIAWKNENGSKRPKTLGGKRNASVSDPATWATFDNATAAVRDAEPGVFSGVGFVFTKNDPYVGIDFDNCLKDGEIDEWARRWLDRLCGYAEVSPSGDGVKVWVCGKLPGSGGGRKIGDDDHTGIEMYDHGRYFTVTGDALAIPDGPIPDRQDVIDELYAWIKSRPEPAIAAEKPKPSTPDAILAKQLTSSGDPVQSHAASALASEVATVAATGIGNRNLQLFKSAAALDELVNAGSLDAATVDRELRAAARSAGLSESEISQTLASARRKVGGKARDLSHVGKGRPAIELADVPIEAVPDVDTRLAGLPRTDLGNAERLIARFGADLRYCPAWKNWFVWDGRRFAPDETGAVFRLAERTVRGMLHETATLDDADERKAHAGWQRASESRARIESMIKLAQTLDGVPVIHDDLDRDGWLLNCPNGTVDLRTGELRPHDRADLITQLCPVEYDPDAKCPLWDATLDLFFDGDDRLITYWQRLGGYFLTGVVREHVLPICYGTGANGKSTILGTLIAVMGKDYALQAPPSMLASHKHEPHPTVLADLFRKRLVVAIETEEGQTLNESLIKMLTGGDDIRARRLYQDHWSFTPTHTVVMATNHRPVIKGRDRGIWRRAKLIPFSVSLPPEQWDTTVKERLAAEYPGILAWAVRGCLAWREVGLHEPETITRATEAYQEEQDVIGSFLAAVAVTGPSYRVKAGKLYEAYRSWAEGAGEPVISLRKFGESLTERGFAKTNSGGIWYLGIGLPESGQ